MTARVSFLADYRARRVIGKSAVSAKNRSIPSVKPRARGDRQITPVVDLAPRLRPPATGSELAALDAELAEIEREKDELAMRRDRLPRLSRRWFRAQQAIFELVERHWELTVRRGGVLREMGGSNG